MNSRGKVHAQSKANRRMLKAAGLWAAPITGASMNPIRSLAPDLVRGNLSTSWIYIVGPVLGALLGVLFEWILRGEPTAAGAIAAQGFKD